MELAAQYRLGDLSPEDRTSFELHVQACPECRGEALALAPVLDDLALAAPEVEPPTDLLDRLKQRIRSEPKKQRRKPWLKWDADAIGSGLFFAWSRESRWEPTQVKGIEARKLFVDRGHDRVTMLIRMAAGTAYPRHVHGGPEECYVLEGDLRVDDKTMGQGDYQFAPEGCEHSVQSTEGGCLLLISSSLSDRTID
jgi:anti-sigma factor ChrR (cupin superfamily)